MTKSFTSIYEKVMGDTQAVIPDFISKRMAGAKKIYNDAQKKGGVALLTASHFKVKGPAYTKAKRRINSNDNLEFLKSSIEDCLDKLKDVDNLTQTEFQGITGQLEVYGEVYIETKSA